MRWVIAALVVAGVATPAVEQALAASEPITTSAACCTFGKPSFTIDRGTVATFQNADPGVAPHDVTAVDSGAGGKPLFSSATINQGQTPVKGTESLAAGTYRFFCTVHPIQMTGDLVVTGGPPAVRVKILSRKLDGVVSKRKLKVRLRATSALRGVSLTARRGKRKLGAKRGIKLPAGAPRTISLPLSRGGRAALKGLGTAKVKVTATVPGGKTATAKRRLR